MASESWAHPSATGSGRAGRSGRDPATRSPCSVSDGEVRTRLARTGRPLRRVPSPVRDGIRLRERARDAYRAGEDPRDPIVPERVLPDVGRRPLAGGIDGDRAVRGAVDPLGVGAGEDARALLSRQTGHLGGGEAGGGQQPHRDDPEQRRRGSPRRARRLPPAPPRAARSRSGGSTPTCAPAASPAGPSRTSCVP